MNIQLCKCEDSPFDDGEFDVLTARMAYHHFDDKESFAKKRREYIKAGRIPVYSRPRDSLSYCARLSTEFLNF